MINSMRYICFTIMIEKIVKFPSFFDARRDNHEGLPGQFIITSICLSRSSLGKYDVAFECVEQNEIIA